MDENNKYFTIVNQNEEENEEEKVKRFREREKKYIKMRESFLKEKQIKDGKYHLYYDFTNI